MASETTSDSMTMAELKELIAKKEDIEQTMDVIEATLTVPGGPGLTGNLVDAQGFPRSDIDVYAVRAARNSLACLRTDLREVMLQIERGLAAVHRAARKSGTQVAGRREVASAAAEAAPAASASLASSAHLQPFATIGEVADGGPAQQCGLVVGDALVSFGTVNETNHGALSALGMLVRNSEGREVRLVVERGRARVALTLVPRVWAGRGLLGCLVKPLD